MMRVLLWALPRALVVFFLLWLLGYADAGELVGSTSYGEWIQNPEAARVFNLNGAMAALVAMGVECRNPVNVAQVNAAMTAGVYRFGREVPWIAAAVVILHYDYGCRATPEKLKVFLEVMNEGGR